MKNKIMHTLGLAMILLMGTMLCACDEDVMQSQMLSGRWQGDWGSYYEFTQHRRVSTFECYDTRLEFYPDHSFASRGTGKQIDHYEYGPYEYLYYRFTWSIKDGIVTLRYPHDGSLNTYISEYRMTDNEFYGRFADSRNRFHMYKYTQDVDWSRYNGDYWYYEREYVGPYYAPARDKAAAPNGIVRRGNRFLDQQ